MRDEINDLIDILESDDFTFRLGMEVRALSGERPDEINRMIRNLNRAISRVEPSDHKYLGLYHFFLGCCHFELNDFPQAITSATSAILQTWDSELNKAIAHLLLGTVYNSELDFPKARKEVNAFVKFLKGRYKAYSFKTEKEAQFRHRIENKFRERLQALYNNPLFEGMEPNPAPPNPYPLQDPRQSEEKPGGSLNIPITVTNENYPVNTISNENNPINKVTNENYPANEYYPFNRVSFHLPLSKPEEIMDKEGQEEYYANRTDHDGYMVIPSLPIYDQKARAGKSGEPEISVKPNRFVDIHQIVIEGRTYNVHSLRLGTNKINITPSGKWGWVKVGGKSMNKLKGGGSIEDGDYLLFLQRTNPDDNDIVIIFQHDQKTGESFTSVKRFKKSENRLRSETTEIGKEYDALDIEEGNVNIVGVVYAVAKPISPKP